MTNEAGSPNEGSIGSCVLPPPAAPECDRQKCGSQHAGSVRSQILHHLSIRHSFELRHSDFDISISIFVSPHCVVRSVSQLSVWAADWMRCKRRGRLALAGKGGG